jgi:hypothetical protein
MLYALKLEIEAIRAARAYVFSFGAPQVFAEALEYLRAVSQAGNAVARLVRVYLQLGPNFTYPDETQRAFWEALHQVKIELGLKPPDEPMYNPNEEKKWGKRKRRR